MMRLARVGSWESEVSEVPDVSFQPNVFRPLAGESRRRRGGALLVSLPPMSAKSPWPLQQRA